MDHNILYNCEYQRKYGSEQIVQEHALAYMVSGNTEFITNSGVKIFGPGNMGLIRKNQLLKALKLPEESGKPYKAINVIFNQQTLRAYAAERNIEKQEVYWGNPIHLISANQFLESYFQSLIPYFDHPKELTPSLAEIKTREAIELLLKVNNDFKKLLFDFSEPFKIDLESFMNKNFIFNIPISEFARLTGRSLSTFKRDFSKRFATSPEKWLREKRLKEAHYLIAKEKRKASEVYLHVGFENFSHFSASFKEQFGYNASSI